MEAWMTILAAVVTAAASVGATLITVTSQNSKARAVTDTKIDTLTREVEKHNSIVERTFKLEEQVKTLFVDYNSLHAVTQELAVTARHANERADAAHNRLDRSGVDNR